MWCLPSLRQTWSIAVASGSWEQGATETDLRFRRFAGQGLLTLR